MAEKFQLNEVEVWDGRLRSFSSFKTGSSLPLLQRIQLLHQLLLLKTYGSYVADGYVDGEFVMVESEHAAMSACVGAAADWW